MALWQDIFMGLELDEKACQDIMLLAHLGEAGRSEANEILWDLLSDWALKPEYLDLSHQATHLVNQSRRLLDRPPKTHKDRGLWHWRHYWVPRHADWSPIAAPPAYTLKMGEGGEPLRPPWNWDRRQ